MQEEENEKKKNATKKKSTYSTTYRVQTRCERRICRNQTATKSEFFCCYHSQSTNKKQNSTKAKQKKKKTKNFQNAWQNQNVFARKQVRKTNFQTIKLDYLWHADGSLEATTNTRVNTFWFAPVWLRNEKKSRKKFGQKKFKNHEIKLEINEIKFNN